MKFVKYTHICASSHTGEYLSASRNKRIISARGLREHARRRPCRHTMITRGNFFSFLFFFFAVIFFPFFFFFSVAPRTRYFSLSLLSFSRSREKTHLFRGRWLFRRVLFITRRTKTTLTARDRPTGVFFRPSLNIFFSTTADLSHRRRLLAKQPFSVVQSRAHYWETRTKPIP